MHADTVVGIIGAVVLVSVMVGVFAYEYNNEPEDSSSPAAQDAAAREQFAEEFPDQDADGDLDGDGTPNYLDDDMDGDGVENQNDTVVETVVAISATVSTGPTGGSDATHAFQVGNGSTGFHIEISYSVAGTPADSTTSAVNIQVTGPDGFSTSSSSCDFSGSTATCSISAQEGLASGEYVATMSHNGVAGQLDVGQDIQYDGAITIHY